MDIPVGRLIAGLSARSAAVDASVIKSSDSRGRRSTSFMLIFAFIIVTVSPASRWNVFPFFFFSYSVFVEENVQ